MANEFALEIVTPDKFFYQGEAEMIIVTHRKNLIVFIGLSIFRMIMHLRQI